MKVILLLPAFLYVTLMFINMDLLAFNRPVNLFWITEKNIPVILYTLIFFVLYSVFLWLIFDVSNIISHFKENKLKGKVKDLKSNLYDGQEKVLQKIEKKITETLKKSEDAHVKFEEKLEKQHEKMQDKLDKELKDIREEIRKSKK